MFAKFIGHFYLILLISNKRTKSMPPLPICNVDALTDAAEYVVEQYYRPITPAILISHKSEEDHLHSYILNEATRKIDSVAVLVDTLSQGLEYQMWYFHLIIVDGAESFKTIVSDIHHNDNELFYLVILARSDRVYKQEILDILYICWYSYIVNVNILVEETPGFVSMYSYYPFKDPKNCNSVIPEIINQFVNGSMENNNILFPKKITNMNKCLFYVATWQNPPYDMIGEDTDSTGRFYGIEGDLLDEVSRRINFTSRIVVPDEGRGTIYDNGTATGAFEKLQNEANVSAGSFRSTQTRAQFFTTSTTFHQVANVFIVNDEIFYGPIARLIFPFDYQVWIYIACVLIIGSIIIIILEFVPSPVRDHLIGENNSIAILNMLSGVLGGGITGNTATDFSRYLLLLWLIVTTILRSTYQGALYDFLRTDKTVRPPETIKELLNGEYKICASSAGYQMLEEFPRIKAIAFITPETIMETRFELILKQPQRKLAVVSPEDFIRYYNYRNRQSTLHIVQQRLLIQNNCVFFRKGSFFSYSFDAVIKRLFCSGIVQHIVSRYADINYNKKDEVILTPKIFDNSKIAGAYQIFAIMCILSVLIFILELLSVKFKTLRKLFTTFR